MDRDEILRVLRAFEQSGLEYVLIGAAAMGFHGVIRATEDIDVLIRATADNVERLRVALLASYADDPHIADISAADLLGEYPAIRYYPPTGDLYFDILTRLGEAASFETVDAEIKTVDGTRVRVATPAALYRLKKSTVRPRTWRADVPVQKFRSIEEMNAAPQRSPTKADFDRFLRHCARYWKMAPKVYPRGVLKFKSIEEMRHPSP